MPARSVCEGLGWVEGWRGEVVVAVRIGADGQLDRVHPHDPSWQNWPAAGGGRAGQHRARTFRSSTNRSICPTAGRIYRGSDMATHLILANIQDRHRLRASPASRPACAPASRNCTRKSSRCLARRSPSAMSMPVPATAASWKSMPSTARTTTLKGMGVKFVASPQARRFAIGYRPVSRNLETALKRTYDATPEPEVGGGGGRLRMHGRTVRRELRVMREDCQRHPGGRGDSRAVHPRRSRCCRVFWLP